MSDPYAALDEPPRVVAIKGEVVVSGPYANVAYTPEAARAKAELLRQAADEAARQRERACRSGPQNDNWSHFPPHSPGGRS
jgi:hypothetical protein